MLREKKNNNNPQKRTEKCKSGPMWCCSISGERLIKDAPSPSATLDAPSSPLIQKSFFRFRNQ